MFKVKDKNGRMIYINPTQYLLVSVLNEEHKVRDDIVKDTKLPRTTVFDNLRKLEKNKIVERYSKGNDKRGRPFVFWKVIIKQNLEHLGEQGKWIN